MNDRAVTRVRSAARALVMSCDDEVLLIRFNIRGVRVWLTPGGGLEAGEGPREGLRRELFEETGLADASLGPEIWRRTLYFALGDDWVEQRERIYLVRTTRFEAHTDNMPRDEEFDWFEAFRWWPGGAIASATERFGPRNLGTLLAALLRDGPPETPLDISTL